ncbi:MAG: hypothetical protein ACR2HQ_10445 [Ilumatobacteraceae bacterium]
MAETRAPQLGDPAQRDGHLVVHTADVDVEHVDRVVSEPGDGEPLVVGGEPDILRAPDP